jgi:ankyrin repeat protein
MYFCTLMTKGSVDLEQEFEGRTALHYAIIIGRPLFAIVLLLMGAQCKWVVEKLGDFGRTTLLHLACRPINSQVFEIYDLYRVNEDAEHIGPLSGPFVSKLPFCTRKALIQLFLDNGLDINARDENGITPLRYLVRAGGGELARVQFLHSLGASLDIPDNNGETVLLTCLHNTDVPFDVM